MTAATVRIGFYAGSFDPVTLGHVDIIRRAARLLDRIVVGVGVNPGKAPLFTVAERIALIEAEAATITADTGTAIHATPFTGLAIHAAAAAGAHVIVRGLRNGSDLDYEWQMAAMNAAMAPQIETIFLPASPAVAHVAASLVKAVATMGGDPSPFVSPAIARALADKVARPAPPDDDA